MLEALGMNPSTMATAELMVHRKDIEAAFRESQREHPLGP